MSEHAIGIDLGTTYSALAYINPAGKPEIVPNREGHRITASAVFFTTERKWAVGQEAVEAAGAYPDRLVRWAKRHMGEPDWRAIIAGQPLSAIDVSAMVLKKVKQDAEATLGPIKAAVVTVPAYFDEVRRKATMDAAKLAGLEVLRIINEPTAAALAYAKTTNVRGRVLVYDFGGGTFDVTIVDIKNENEVTVLASEGDHQLGGYDLDQSLAEYIDESFRQRHGKRLLREDDTATRHFVIQRAEDAKRLLSRLTETRITVQSEREGLAHSLTLTRAAFEDLIRPYIARTEMLVVAALKQAEVTASDIDAVLLVGGSTRIPAVQAMLRGKFGKEPLASVNPDEAVALGASIQAGIILAEQGRSALVPSAAAALSRVKLTDVSNHSYGTLSVGEKHGRPELQNSIIIPRNTPLPAEESQTFYTMHDDQREIECTVTQGEDEDPAFVNVIAKADFALPPNRPSSRPVRVMYRYDLNQRMSCEFHDIESGRKKLFDLDMAAEGTTRTSLKPELDDASFDNLEIL